VPCERFVTGCLDAAIDNQLRIPSLPPSHFIRKARRPLKGRSSVQRLNAIVKGRRAVSADTALLLEALTGWDAQIWLTLQAKWDLWHAMKARGNRPKVRPLSKTA
jgi:hypothetical protein